MHRSNILLFGSIAILLSGCASGKPAQQDGASPTMDGPRPEIGLADGFGDTQGLVDGPIVPDHQAAHTIVVTQPV